MTDQPIYDQTRAEAQVGENVAPTPEPVTAVADPSSAPEPVDAGVSHDEEDVKAALERETHDGPGFKDEHELPESDFAGYATEDVEASE